MRGEISPLFMRCCFANCVLSGHDGGNGGQAIIPMDTAIFSMGDTWPTVADSPVLRFGELSFFA